MMFSALLFATTLALPAKQASAIDAIVTRVMRDDGIAGLSVGVARGGDVVYLRGFGVRDPASGARADGYTIYRIGSITKQFTAALVLDAAEHGELRLDETVRDGRSIADLLAQIDGSTWEYDNANYLTLGDVLAAATRRTFADALHERIVAPLHLASTGATLPQARNVATSPLAQPRDLPERTGAAAGISSNVPDLLHWLAALRGGGVIAARDVVAMTTTRLLPDGRPTNYGYGFFIDRWYGWPIAEHPGYLDGFSAIDALCTDDGLAIVVLTNADRVDLIPLAKSIFAIVEPSRDTQSVARTAQPVENEDLAATTALTHAIGELARGTIDPSLLTPAFAARLTPDAIGHVAAQLGPLGPLQLAEFLSREGAVERYRLTFAHAQRIARMTFRGGKIDGLVLESLP